jgi:hypothetical protein
LQKNNILWGKEENYEIWKEEKEDDIIANKILNYNRTKERINLVVTKPSDEPPSEKETKSTNSTDTTSQEDPKINEKMQKK